MVSLTQHTMIRTPASGQGSLTMPSTHINVLHPCDVMEVSVAFITTKCIAVVQQVPIGHNEPIDVLLGLLQALACGDLLSCSLEQLHGSSG